MMLNIFWRKGPFSGIGLEDAMLDFLGTIATAALIVFVVSAPVRVHGYAAPRQARAWCRAWVWIGFSAAASAAS